MALASGAELAADVVVTATGLNLLALGGVQLTVDGAVIEVGETVACRVCSSPESPTPRSAWDTPAPPGVGHHPARPLRTVAKKSPSGATHTR